MNRYLQALFSAKGARLVLDYFKALAWPIVVIVALLLFSAQLKGLLSRINGATVGPNGVSVAMGTGTSPFPAASPGKPSRPGVWFSVGLKPATGLSCEERGKKALDSNGFSSTQAGKLIYGYQAEKIVGAVWCDAPNNSVLITVAGDPSSEIKDKHQQLENAFFNAS
jgi:hypothetical protein